MWGGYIILWCSVFCHSGWEGEAAIGFMRYVSGPVHLVILSPSPSAFAIHSAFPGEFGFDQAGAGATYLGRTEKQMSIRGS